MRTTMLFRRIAPALLVVFACLFVACARSHREVGAACSQPRIELLGFPDCPDTPRMRANLMAALSSVDKGWTFTETNLESLPASDIRRGYPAPTILVNGRDLYGLPVPSKAVMSCRVYEGGVPGAADIARRIDVSLP